MYIVRMNGREFGPRIMREGENGGAAGGAGAGQNTAVGGGQKPDQNNGSAGGNAGGNNNGTFNLETGNIWAPPAPNQGGNTTQPQQQQQQQQQGPSQEEQFNNYINSRDFGFTMSQEDIQNFVSQGDVKGLTNAVNSAMRNSYRSMMLDASRMVNNAVDRAVEQAVQKATGMYQGDKNRMALEQAVPIAANPNVAPIAQAIQKQFLKSGKSLDEANKGVQAFFASLQGTDATKFGLPPSSGSGRNGFGRDMSGFGPSGDDDIDWISFAGVNQ